MNSWPYLFLPCRGLSRFTPRSGPGKLCGWRITELAAGDRRRTTTLPPAGLTPVGGGVAVVLIDTSPAQRRIETTEKGRVPRVALAARARCNGCAVNSTDQMFTLHRTMGAKLAFTPRDLAGGRGSVMLGRKGMTDDRSGMAGVWGAEADGALDSACIIRAEVASTSGAGSPPPTGRLSVRPVKLTRGNKRLVARLACREPLAGWNLRSELASSKVCVLG